jgi:hypothetical protein
MKPKLPASPLALIIGVIIIVGIAALVLLTAIFTPEQSNPAFSNAIAFVEAAAVGDDAAATAYLSETLQTYVAATCPNGSVSACIAGYIPDEWGGFRDIGFRRATPEGAAWNVDLIGYWQQGSGFSGVCVFTEMAQERDGVWRVQRWAGFAWCGDPLTRDMARNPDAPNQAP